jgi:hypothetical protein
LEIASKGKSRFFSLQSIEDREKWMDHIRQALSPSHSSGLVSFIRLQCKWKNEEILGNREFHLSQKISLTQKL